MKEILPRTNGEKTREIIAKFGFEVVDGEVDLRTSSNEKVLNFLDSLRGLGLFHGTNARERFDTLEARQANDSAKESGNKKAVYADEGITVPIANAILNKRYIASKFSSFVTGWSNNEDGKTVFSFSPSVYQLFKSNDPDLFHDGYIYFLDKTNFINAEDAGTEWHSESDQKAVFSFHVSKKLAESIFIVGDTVVEFSPEEMNMLNQFKSNS